MADKISSIKERILKIPENKGISKENFFTEIGMTYGNFKGKSKGTPINSNAIVDILSIYPDINLEWLLTGKGSMLKSEQTSATAVLDHIADSSNMIPLVSVTAVGGLGNANFSIAERDIKDYYRIPKFDHKKVDFMIEVEGSSMYPKYNSGDVVACRVIQEDKFIQWNKTHVIATKDQGLLIKRIKESEEKHHLTMVSDNKDYPPFDVPKSEIEGIALVVGVVRLE